jgi:hypothetical protein
MMEVNEDITIHITTNGTVFNKRVQSILQKLRSNIVVSMDAWKAETYESIRVNANHAKVMENLRQFMALPKDKVLSLTLAVCPMQSNAYEVVDLMKFANGNNIHIFFNTVINPPEQSLITWSPTQLDALIKFYQGFSFDTSTYIRKENSQKFAGLIKQLIDWRDFTGIRTQNKAERNLASFLSITLPPAPVGWEGSALFQPSAEVQYLLELQVKRSIRENYKLQIDLTPLEEAAREYPSIQLFLKDYFTACFQGILLHTKPEGDALEAICKRHQEWSAQIMSENLQLEDALRYIHTPPSTLMQSLLQLKIEN